MRTLFIFFSVLIISKNNAYSQASEIGIFGGPNLNQLRGNDYVKEAHKSLIAFSAGAFLRIPIKNKLNLLTELQFERTGSKIPDLIFADPFGNNMGQSDVLNFLNYLVLPVMAEYSFGGTTRFTIHGGPFIGYLLDQHYVIKWQNGNYDDVKGSKNSWNLDRFNFGLSAGAGVSMPLYKKIFLDLRIENHLGLLNLNNGTFEDKLKTNSTQFTIGFGLPLK